ncbi:DUF2335 domain-containing protein [Listeria monocytogenes]|uniref:DUF2335 domain-containing protein n=1 Tax=Listeria seeligeri TaxID=1640 RepID=UPI0010B47DDF|nr:DUF2335 domain-containing protein [Listeria seeligeri]EAC2511317.1 DUF2335 domain-containing protein [Listeria monocytogenes]EAC3828228.1 DUF2335 domain-containing protein [Listeria monocytogenes]EAC4368299.1 DUF2335 domain-containing protein [Listeria monocytogenes]EAC5612220.1 DUF2335 domain-containing protein [Listeria monocytogenes]EAC8933676.1 DUF2335 domain-containing protein [Listeria monocytogenes]
MILEVASESMKNNSTKAELEESSSELEEVLNDGALVDELIEKMGPEKSVYISQKIEQSSFKGPLPPAEQLEKYEKVLPGAADRIIKMAEDQAVHRRSQEDKKLQLNKELNEMHLKSETVNNNRGLVFAFVLGLLFVIGGFILLIFDKKVSGFVALILPLATLLGTFIYRKKQEQKSENNIQEDEQ